MFGRTSRLCRDWILFSLSTLFFLSLSPSLPLHFHMSPHARTLTRTHASPCSFSGRACAEQDSFGCLDPQTKAGSTSAAAARNRPFSEVIVFVLGGGCYTEYFNLLEMQHQQQQQLQPPDGGLQSIVYGGSELCSPEGFLAQLQALAGSS